ncbi:hypothetical protein T552_00252 [Pneumocystis carinii B80]|uniref:Uncharacterized protein n=1 Tax=Pneumocystis carinii (strain B80) TaxID=1408658 RepID=A0A0W4ZTA9_PNEC8|nr:hypothetical protein T552_00252 [Pneumocystis carinii B80]KTW31614.1 hypothetical protein T552_00252 [Pneumocystis carinii B80]
MVVYGLNGIKTRILIDIDKKEIERIVNCLKNGLERGKFVEEQYECVSQLKKIVRDDETAEIMGSGDGFSILFQLAFPDDIKQEKSIDATRCIFNIMLLYDGSRDIFIEKKGIERIIKEYMHFLELPLIHRKENFDLIFVYTRILFLLTTQHGKAITILKELGIFQIINSCLTYFEAYLVSNDSWSEQDLYTVQEYLKLLFNLIRHEDTHSLINISPLIKLLNLSFTNLINQQFTFEIINCLLNLPIETFFDDEHISERCVEQLLNILDMLLSSIDLGIYPNDSPPSINSDTLIETRVLSLVTFLRKILKHSTEAIRALLVSRLLPQSKDRENILGRGDTLSSKTLRAITLPTPLVREPISWLLYELNHSNVTEFINSIGFGYASGFLASHGIPFVSPDSKDFDAPHGINPITGQTLEAERMALSHLPEMTEEEKERDAERLFIMFQRLEKNSILSVKNPIRDAFESGKFSE